MTPILNLLAKLHFVATTDARVMAPFSLSIEPAISTLYHPPSYLKAIKPQRASHYQGQSWNFSNPISYLKVA